MLNFLAPRKENNKSAFATLPDSSTSYVATVPERRNQLPSILVTAAHNTYRKPTAITSSAVEKSAYPGWYEPPHLTKTPWELERHKKQQRLKTSEFQLPTKMFKNLPREVYGCIIVQLELLHLEEVQVCSACYLRDLHSLSLVNRAWDKATTIPMYHKVSLFVNKEHTKLPKLKIEGTGRLKLLRRTLRCRSTLARHVRELHISDFQTLYQNATIDQEEIVSLVASLVMACPNLERLVGFRIPSSINSFDRLSYALATRTKLKEKVWMLKEPVSDVSDEEEESPGAYVEACDPTERFLELNSNHTLLDTLVLHEEDPMSSTTLNFRAVIGTLRQLPALQNLSISGFSASSFTNMTLNALPRNLRSLRLENLPGINDKGLQRFTNSDLMLSIETLLLIDLEVSNMTTVSNILSVHSANLKAFSLAQYRAPGLSARKSIPAAFHSRTLRYMHWEVRSDAGPLPNLPSASTPLIAPEEPLFPFTNEEPISCLATSLLATSIRNGAFPSLRRISIPHDPQGLVQELCTPQATALLSCDMPFLQSRTSISTDTTENLRLKSRADSAIGSPTSSMDYTQAMLTPTRSRLAAQAHILAARKNALMTVRVYDPNNDLKINKVIGGFVGKVGSQIIYDLEADEGRMNGTSTAEGAERNDWITNVKDLVSNQDHEVVTAHERLWTACGHRARANTVMVEELF